MEQGEVRLDLWEHKWQLAGHGSFIWWLHCNHSSSLGCGLSHGTQITSVLFSPRRLRSFKWKCFARLPNTPKKGRRREWAGPRTGGRREMPPILWGWFCSDLPLLGLKPTKPSKMFQTSDYRRGCPNEVERNLTLAPAAPETRQSSYTKSRKKYFSLAL